MRKKFPRSHVMGKRGILKMVFCFFLHSPLLCEFLGRHGASPCRPLFVNTGDNPTRESPANSPSRFSIPAEIELSLGPEMEARGKQRKGRMWRKRAKRRSSSRRKHGVGGKGRGHRAAGSSEKKIHTCLKRRYIKKIKARDVLNKFTSV